MVLFLVFNLKIKEEDEMTEYGIRWQEFNKRDEVVTKEKIFKTEKAREKFIDKLVEKDNFYQLDAWLN